MVNHDISYRIASKGIITTSNIGLTTTETHMTHHHIMCIYPERFAGYTNSVAGGVNAVVYRTA